ncbi:hypothetical protein [Filimonas effusa]|uniref:Uncharacterized protein n=1 Tax=Filimonas effusa TaxID=2508721 RepID=A0A4Q1CZP3_9BACT|nr:hypothetical protein [Filimonas effusa]RXK80888.1 hypothetical protein ESB13_22295 [Filimonas effusa]
MVEVFKTNVNNRHQANLLIAEIHQHFNTYRVNFDLEDCDHILRVACDNGGQIEAALVISVLRRYGFTAEILPG